MNGIESKNCERLYLHKDNENEIYVNNCQNLKQHQVDSLRFLFRQFKKNKHGAVLNFPPGSGKSFVVTLFLNAISSLLNERVVIFCNDDEELDHWKELLLTWTDYKNEEIAVESSNPRLKKKIFLKKAEDLNSYLRCHWGVVVIKDENMCKILQKVVIDANLKIWITSTDVKKDVDLLFFIFNWMFPKSNVNINEIITQVKPQDKMTQDIIMNTFIEDFVLRENKIKIIKDTKNSQELKLYKGNQKGITRKNKDATGNKIKKSKRTIDDTTEQTNNIPVNISEVKEEPEVSNLTDMKDESCIQGFTNEQTNNIMVNISNEIKEEPEGSRNLSNLEDKSCIQGFDSKTNLHNSDSFNLLESNQNHAIKNEDIQANNEITENNENSTESLDFGDVQENFNTTASVDFEDINKNSNETLYEDKNPDENETVNYDIDNEKKMEFDTTEKSENNDLDFKMSELEERTMKKFKGSLLDSLF